MKMIGILLILMLGFLLPSVNADSSETSVGYEFLDGGNILNIWNEKNDYYFEYPSMIQLTNHYNQYWTHNTLCLGYYTSSWKYLCTDTLPISWDLDSDNLTYVQVSGAKDLTIGGKSARINFTYYLEPSDEELTVNLKATNIGASDINNALRFVWNIDNIAISNTFEDDVIRIWDTKNYSEFDLNDTLDLTYTDLEENKFEMHDTSTTQYLRLRWKYNDYKVKVKSKPSQYNAPTTLILNYDKGIKSGITKQTNFYWVDAENCFVTWGDKYTNTGSQGYPPPNNYPSYTKFWDDNSSWGMTCHIDPISTACKIPNPPSTCVDGIENSGSFRCRIQVREEGSTTWKTITTTDSNLNCNNDDATGQNYAELLKSNMRSFGYLKHNNKTDFRCQGYLDTPDDVFLECKNTSQAINSRFDYWLNNNTPIANDVQVVANYSGVVVAQEDVRASDNINIFLANNQLQIKYPILDYIGVYEVTNAIHNLFISISAPFTTNELIYWRIENQTWNEATPVAEYGGFAQVNETNSEVLSSLALNT